MFMGYCVASGGDFFMGYCVVSGGDFLWVIVW
jgi:NADH:ubiquinone oxidoreductase subunit B-like Fe-S oxidoreductase